MLNHTITINRVQYEIDIDAIYSDKELTVVYNDETSYQFPIDGFLLDVAITKLMQVRAIYENASFGLKYELLKWYEFYIYLASVGIHDAILSSANTVVQMLHHEKDYACIRDFEQFNKETFTDNIATMLQNLVDTFFNYFQISHCGIDVRLTNKSFYKSVCDFTFEEYRLTENLANSIDYESRYAVLYRANEATKRFEINFNHNDWTASFPLMPTFTIYRNNEITHEFNYKERMRKLMNTNSEYGRLLALKLPRYPLIFVCTAMKALGLNNPKLRLGRR